MCLWISVGHISVRVISLNRHPYAMFVGVWLSCLDCVWLGTHLVNFNVICVYHDHIFTVWQDFDLSHSRIAKIQNLEQLSQVQVSCH